MLLETQPGIEQPSLVAVRRWRASPRAVLLAMAVVLAIIGVASWSLFTWIDYRRELASARAYGTAVLDATSEHLKRIVDTNDLLLQQVLQLLAENPVERFREDHRAWRQLRDLAHLPAQPSVISVVGSSGEMLVSTRAFGDQMPSASVIDGSVLARHRGPSSPALEIGPTSFSPVDGKPYLVVSRRWEDQDGSFLGVVAAAVRADNFLDFAGKLVPGPQSTVSVIREDGLVLIRRPMTPEILRLQLDGYELFTEHLRRAPEGSYDAVSPADGERRLVLYRRVADLPLIAVTGIAKDELLGDWRRHAYQTSALVLAGLAAIGGLAFVGMRHAGREEQALRQLSESRAHERLLMREVDHRSKNLLAILQSVVRQTARNAEDKEALARALIGRIQALATAHELLTAEHWTAVGLRALVDRELRPFADTGAAVVEGDDVQLPPKTAMTVALVLHELATNAAKHGALSVPEGRVELRMRAVKHETPGVALEWRESGGPPSSTPAAKGFGTTLLQQGVAHDLGGSVSLDFRPEGLRADIFVPLPPAS